ncbi:hypothetical protein NC653_003830 [Populus alba x Populus x berolinensis]|uniref:Uncharacterized protein n=1 Tax=Populus alba x Populus x berolinensis TaxID=444605 RepID=A0AAD6RTK2_9ROSI|nr:hypothetical protein NC653_003830 [Populus alba x Populus x berolinensis]
MTHGSIRNKNDSSPLTAINTNTTHFLSENLCTERERERERPPLTSFKENQQHPHQLTNLLFIATMEIKEKLLNYNSLSRRRHLLRQDLFTGHRLFH